MDATNTDPAYTTHSLSDKRMLVEIKVYDDEKLGTRVVTTHFGYYASGHNQTLTAEMTREEARAHFAKCRRYGLAYTGPWRSSRFAPAAVAA